MRMQDTWDSQGKPAGEISDQYAQPQDERKAGQKRTFTRWMNVFLQRRDPPVEVNDLFEDIQDGRILMALLEELSGSKLLYRFRSSSHRIFRLNNISKALAFLDDRHVKLLGIDASGIADGIPSVVLNLIWNIIMHFQVKEVTGGLQRHMSSSLSSLSMSSYPSYGDLSPQPNDIGSYSCNTLPSKGRRAARERKYHGKAIKTLLQWVQRCTSKYGVDVCNFGKSWRNGLAFLALIKSINPNLVDLRESLSRQPNENIQQAFMIAHHDLDIPPLLEPEDVTCTSPDEQSIIAYVSMFLGHHSGIDEDHTIDIGVPEIPNFGSLESVNFGETLADDPEAQALLKGLDKRSEQQLWKRWSRRSSGSPRATSDLTTSRSDQSIAKQVAGSSAASPLSKKNSRAQSVLQPPSPLDAGVVSQEIRWWMEADWDQGYRKQSLYSLSSDEGIYSLSALDSDEEDAYSYILDLNKEVFQPYNKLKRQVPKVEEETAEEMNEESKHLEACETFDGGGSKHQEGDLAQKADFDLESEVGDQSVVHGKFDLDKNESSSRETTNNRAVFVFEPETESRSKEEHEQARVVRGQSKDEGDSREKKRKVRKSRLEKDRYDRREDQAVKAKIFKVASWQKDVEEGGASSSLGSLGPQLTVDEGRDSPWTARQSIAGRQKEDEGENLRKFEEGQDLGNEREEERGNQKHVTLGSVEVGVDGKLFIDEAAFEVGRTYTARVNTEEESDRRDSAAKIDSTKNSKDDGKMEDANEMINSTEVFQPYNQLKRQTPKVEEETAEEVKEESKHLEAREMFTDGGYKHLEGDLPQKADFDLESEVGDQSVVHRKFDLDRNRSSSRETTNNRAVFDLEPEAESRIKEHEEVRVVRGQSNDEGDSPEEERKMEAPRLIKASWQKDVKGEGERAPSEKCGQVNERRTAQEEDQSIHPSIILTTSSSLGSRGSWNLSQMTMDEGRDSSWIARQSIAGRQKEDEGENLRRFEEGQDLGNEREEERGNQKHVTLGSVEVGVDGKLFIDEAAFEVRRTYTARVNTEEESDRRDSAARIDSSKNSKDDGKMEDANEMINSTEVFQPYNQLKRQTPKVEEETAEEVKEESKRLEAREMFNSGGCQEGDPAQKADFDLESEVGDQSVVHRKFDLDKNKSSSRETTNNRAVFVFESEAESRIKEHEEVRVVRGQSNDEGDSPEEERKMEAPRLIKASWQKDVKGEGERAPSEKCGQVNERRTAQEEDQSIHPSIILTTSSSLGSRGSWNLSQLTMDEGRDSSWIARQSIAGRQKEDEGENLRRFEEGQDLGNEREEERGNQKHVTLGSVEVGVDGKLFIDEAAFEVGRTYTARVNAGEESDRRDSAAIIDSTKNSKVPKVEEETAEEVKEESKHLEAREMFNSGGCQEGDPAQKADFDLQSEVEDQSVVHRKFDLDKNKSSSRETTNNRAVFDLEPEAESPIKEHEEVRVVRGQSNDEGDSPEEERKTVAKLAKDGYDRREDGVMKANIFEVKDVEEDGEREFSGSGASWSLSQLTMSEGRDTPWTFQQSFAERQEEDEGEHLRSFEEGQDLRNEREEDGVKEKERGNQKSVEVEVNEKLFIDKTECDVRETCAVRINTKEESGRRVRAVKLYLTKNNEDKEKTEDTGEEINSTDFRPVKTAGGKGGKLEIMRHEKLTTTTDRPGETTPATDTDGHVDIDDGDNNWTAAYSATSQSFSSEAGCILQSPAASCDATPLELKMLLILWLLLYCCFILPQMNL